MNELQWLRCTDPNAMLAFLRERARTWKQMLLGWLS
jgi:hypothetical protein